MNGSQSTRIRFVFAGIAIAALVLAASLYSRQIVSGKEYAAKADRQYARPSANLLDRGLIYFSGKDDSRVAAATIDQGSLVYVNPKLVIDAKTSYDALSQFIEMDRAFFLKKTADKSNSYFELADKVGKDKAQSITALSLPGIGIIRESWRSYPGNELAAHAIGLVGESNSTSTIEGKYGLERYYEKTLNRPSIVSSKSIFASIFAGVRETLVGDGEKRGDIVTTIEPTIQGYLEKILADTDKSWHPEEIGGIVIDPKTGEVIAMSSLPTFNPNDTSSVKDPSVFSDPLMEHVYEMGSIMKPLTMSIGLDTGNFTPSSTYDDTGTMKLNGKTIGNYDGKARGVIDMQQILSQSLNVGAATIGMKVGNTVMADYLSRFGLNMKTGIDLPNEAVGQMGNLKNGKEIDVATASYGQGIAVSPIEMTKSLAILANGGYMIYPHVVKEIDYTDGSKDMISIKRGEQVIRMETATAVTKMLVEVVDKALKNGAIKMERYTIAAKTGTAQIPDRVHGGYYTDMYLHSFFGYFPAYDPEFLVFLYQIHPQGAEYASATLTNPFNQLAKFLINYYNIPPDR
ncbi:MAG: penicillin-binding protein 2 [Candidatus Taylorbacteria bacterium]|nr:penicillin-binding protein 2 [Candidatus Taylorbacteria bacterium]